MTVTAMLLFATLEPALNEVDLTKYVITQGGLAIVIIVVLWSYRRDTMRIIVEQSDRLKVMTDLAASSTAAQTRTADALDRMSRAVERLDERRAAQKHGQ